MLHRAQFRSLPIDTPSFLSLPEGLDRFRLYDCAGTGRAGLVVLLAASASDVDLASIVAFGSTKKHILRTPCNIRLFATLYPNMYIVRFVSSDKSVLCP